MKTHILFVLDKSGSMTLRRDQTISGFNEYLKTIQADSNLEKARFTLVTFDTEFITVAANELLADVAGLTSVTYVPEGLTALYDAVAHGLKLIKDQVKKKHRALVIIMTDGEENSSREYSRAMIFDMIKDYEDKGNYTFVFLGCDQDVWAEGGKMGVAKGNTKEYDGANVGGSFMMMAAAVSKYAGGKQSRSTTFWDEDDDDA